MDKEKTLERNDDSKVARKDALQSWGGTECSGCGNGAGSTHRRTFLGGIVTSVLGVVGLSGLASAAPTSKVVAERLEDHRVIVEVLVENALLNDRVLEAIENSSTGALVESSAVEAKRNENTGFVDITFPGGPDDVRLGFGEEPTDVSVTLPDDVDGKALVQEMNEASGQVTTEAPTCCDDNGYCNLCEEDASGRCTYPQFPVGTCGSYQCGVTICDDPDGSGSMYDWSCDCCGGGHPYCGNVPTCYSGIHC